MAAIDLRLAIGIILTALTLASCGRPAEHQDNTVIRIAAGEGHALRIGYDFPEPVDALDFGPSAFVSPGMQKALSDAGVTISDANGRTVVGFDPPVRRFDLALDAESAAMAQGYPALVGVQGGRVLYTGAVTPWRSPGERMRLRLEIDDALNARAPGERISGDRLSGLQPPFFLFLEGGGGAAPPGWISAAIGEVREALSSVLEPLSIGAPAISDVFVAFEPAPLGALNLSGDALPGQVLLRFQGAAWGNPDGKARRLLALTAAHEFAHGWQAAARPKTLSEPAWIHEGAATAIALEALLRSGLWGPEQAEAALEEERRVCVRALESGFRLAGASVSGARREIYACGLMLVMAMSGGEAIEFWREVAETARINGGYDEDLILEVASAGDPDRKRTLSRFIRARSADGAAAIDQLFLQAARGETSLEPSGLD